MRNKIYDSLKGIAMIGIILIHVHSYFVFFHSSSENPQIFTLLLANLSRFSVPVFIFSAGLFLTRKGFKDFWKPKLWGVAIPYILFSIIGYFVKYSHWNLYDLVYKIIMGQVFTPFYFIPLLFQFYILYYILLQYIKSKAGNYLLLLLSLVVNIASNLGYFNFLPRDYFVISPTNFAFFFSVGFFLKNEWKGNLEDITHDTKFIGIALISLFIMTVLLIKETIGDRQAISNHTIIYPILFIISYMGLDWKEGFIDHTSRIGANSMGIFLLHPFVIHTMHKWDPYFFGGAWISILVTTLLNVYIPYFIWKVLKKFTPSL